LEIITPAQQRRRAAAAPNRQRLAVPRRPERPDFETIALAWRNERYEEMHRAQPERADKVGDDLRLHLIPAFGDLFDLDLADGRDRIKAWVRAMAGFEPVTDCGFEPAARPYA